MAGESVQKLTQGDRAPDFELPGVDGDTHSLSDFRDYEGILIVFTCNHCPYAKAKIDTLNELADEYDSIAVVGINPNDADDYPEDSFAEMKARVEDGTVQYDAYLRDETQEIAKAYGAVCTPDPYFFKQDDSEFVLVYHGRLDDALNPDAEPTQHDMREVIEATLSGNSIAKDFNPSRGCTIKWKEGNEPDYWNSL
ncbi:MAG: thioredoxin family protein [Halobacteriaceae archaeon]